MFRPFKVQLSDTNADCWEQSYVSVFFLLLFVEKSSFSGVKTTLTPGGAGLNESRVVAADVQLSTPATPERKPMLHLNFVYE